MRALLLHNPAAGDGNVSAEELYGWLGKCGLSPTYCSSKENGYREALAKALDLLIVAGGDGTVGKAVRHLADRNVPIAVLPTGTANNVARSLGLDGDFEAIVASIREGGRRRLDSGRVSGPWGERRFVEGVGLGAVAATILDAGPKVPKAQKIEAGRETFSRILAKAEPVHVALDVDGETVEGRFLLVEILNLPFSGPSLPIAHAAEPGDQQFDIAFLPEEKRQEMIDWLRGEPEGSPSPVTILRGRDIGLSWDGSPLRIDDTIVCDFDGKPEARVEMETEGLQVCVPAQASRPEIA